MKKLCATLLMLAIALQAIPALSENAVFWTKKDDPFYHVNAGCGGMKGAVPLSMEAALEFGKLACPTCAGGHRVPSMEADGYNSLADTTFLDRIDVPLRKTTGTGYETMYWPLLVGDWIYYARASYEYEDSWGAEDYAICRCRAADMQGEEVLLRNDQVGNRIGEICGMRDTGKDILLWYTTDFEVEDKKSVGTVYFWRMSYDAKERQCILRHKLESPNSVTDVTVAGNRLWFSWYEWTSHKAPKKASGGIYEVDLENPKARSVYSDNRAVYSVRYAYGKLYFFDVLDTLRYCTLDPDTGRMSVLRDVGPGAASDGDGERFTIVGRKMYAWDDGQKATISMNLDGSNAKTVSKTRYGFQQVWNGYVLACAQREAKSIPGQYYSNDSTYVYYPEDAEWPEFAPDSCKKQHIGYLDFMLGNRFYSYKKDGTWKVTLRD